jgi:hypothetical protein
VFEFYAARGVADREIAEILHDEPGWAGTFAIVIVDFTGAEPKVTSAN